MHQIREAIPLEYSELGKLMVDVYSQLEGFPKQDEIPEYYYHLMENNYYNEYELGLVGIFL